MFPSCLSIRLISLLALLSLMTTTAAQTCKPASIPATTPTAQFTTNGNGTLTDTKTGLMWKVCSEGQSGVDCSTGTVMGYTWQAALAQVQIVNTSGGFAGYTDWRLPNIKELRSIVEWQCLYPAINLSLFPATPADALFWSSSPVVYVANGVLVVYYYNGSDDWYNKNSAFQVRLVRSAQ